MISHREGMMPKPIGRLKQLGHDPVNVEVEYSDIKGMVVRAIGSQRRFFVPRNEFVSISYEAKR